MEIKLWILEQLIEKLKLGYKHLGSAASVAVNIDCDRTFSVGDDTSSESGLSFIDALKIIYSYRNMEHGAE